MIENLFDYCALPFLIANGFFETSETNGAGSGLRRIHESFDQSNRTLFYQLAKEISELYQGNDSVAVDYTNMKRLSDELDDISEVMECVLS